MGRRTDPGSPTPKPKGKQRRVRGGSVLIERSYRVKVIAPRIGGGSRAKQIDPSDLFRATEIRQALRFWWRALQRDYTDAEDLRRRETALFGDATDRESGRVSQVSVAVAEVQPNVGPGGIRSTTGPSRWLRASSHAAWRSSRLGSRTRRAWT